MKRDILITKEILIAIEDDLFEKNDQFVLPNIDNSILEGHLKLLENEYLIQIESKGELSTGEKLYHGISLTNRGYDYLKALKKNNLKN